jgi:hypothetical protein
VKIKFLICALSILLMASGCGRQPNRIVGRWEMDSENEPGNPAYEFLRGGTGISINTETGFAKQINYKFKGNKLTISFTETNAHDYQIEFQAENKIVIWEIKNNGDLYDDRIFFRKPLMEMPLEPKIAVATKMHRPYTILEAQQSTEEPDTWLLSIQLRFYDEPKPYKISKDSSSGNWALTQIYSTEELAVLQSTAASKTRVADIEASSSAFDKTVMAGRPTEIPRLADQDLSGLISEASTLCRLSFEDDSSPNSIARAPSPAVVIKDTDPTYFESYTSEQDFLQQASNAAEVKSLVCIRTDREKTGDYSGGRSGYRLILSVHILSWPDGQLLAGKIFEGSGPGGPFVLSSAKPGDPIYGAEPTQAVMDYVLSILD